MSKFVAPRPPEGWVPPKRHEVKFPEALREWGFPCASAACEHESFKGFDRGAMATAAFFAGWFVHSSHAEEEAHRAAEAAARAEFQSGAAERVLSLVAELEAHAASL